MRKTSSLNRPEGRTPARQAADALLHLRRKFDVVGKLDALRKLGAELP
jgi:hypothetical protein